MASEHPQVNAVLAECGAHLYGLEAAFAARSEDLDGAPWASMFKDICRMPETP